VLRDKKTVVRTASVGRAGAARRARATHLGGEAQAGPTTCKGGGRPSLDPTATSLSDTGGVRGSRERESSR
jgi:hypothetical protein